MKVIVCITGASGVIYGFKTVESLLKQSIDVSFVISKNGYKVIREELSLSEDDPDLFGKLVDGYSPDLVKRYSPDDLTAPFASGSSDFDACLIVPCSMATLGKIASGVSDNLIVRTADVFLKERRKLILLFREMPLNLIQIENMKKLVIAGAVVMPASPAFYTHPESKDDMINFVVGRVLDQLHIRSHNLYTPYKDE